MYTAAVVAFGVVGSLLLLTSHAATPTASLEAENGTISAAASTVSDTTASGSLAVKFGNGSGGGTRTTNCLPSASQTMTNTVSHLCGFPDTTNTGVPAGVTLTNSGSIDVTTDGAVVQNLNINGHITIDADNVTIKNVRITYSSYYPIDYSGHTGLVVQDSEIIGTNTDVTAALSFTNYTARRLNVHGSADGIKADSNTDVEDSYIHDLATGSGTHNDGIQNTGGSNVTVRHNTIIAAGTSCVQFGSENGSPSNILVDSNLLDGAGYMIYLDVKGTNRTITNNHFGRDYEFGLFTGGGALVQSGNIWDDTGASVTL